MIQRAEKEESTYQMVNFFKAISLMMRWKVLEFSLLKSENKSLGIGTATLKFNESFYP